MYVAPNWTKTETLLCKETNVTISNQINLNSENKNHVRFVATREVTQSEANKGNRSLTAKISDIFQPVFTSSKENSAPLWGARDTGKEVLKGIFSQTDHVRCP